MNDTDRKKKYTRPQIKYELTLETRAGSPIGNLGTDPFDLQETQR